MPQCELRMQPHCGECVLQVACMRECTCWPSPAAAPRMRCVVRACMPSRGQVLKELAPYKNLVIATGGGTPIKPKNWSYMHNGIVAWLQGEPELLGRRVVAQGLDKRPLLFGDGVSGARALAQRCQHCARLPVRVQLRRARMLA